MDDLPDNISRFYQFRKPTEEDLKIIQPTNKKYTEPRNIYSLADIINVELYITYINGTSLMDKDYIRINQIHVNIVYMTVNWHDTPLSTIGKSFSMALKVLEDLIKYNIFKSVPEHIVNANEFSLV